MVNGAESLTRCIYLPRVNVTVSLCSCSANNAAAAISQIEFSSHLAVCVLTLHSIHGSGNAGPTMSTCYLNNFITHVWFHGGYRTFNIRLEFFICTNMIFDPKKLIYACGPLLLKSPNSSVHCCTGPSRAES